jgi:Uma2 family endonuclease
VYGAPDLVIEVLSPYPRVGRVDEKLNWYERYGVRECWLVHQIRRQVEIVTWPGGAAAHRIFEQHDPLESSVLPGFDRSLSQIVPGYLP